MNLLDMNVGEQRDIKVGLVTYTAERTGPMTWVLHSTVEGWKTANVSYAEAVALKQEDIHPYQLNWQ